MYQFLRLEKPIPSCEIYELDHVNNKWIFVYALNVPFELTNGNTEELIIYEYISDLYLKLLDTVHEESVNLKVTTLNEYMQWLEIQRLEDVKYRENWKKNHPKAKPNTVDLANKAYTHQELLEKEIHYIANLIKDEKGITTFAAI